MPTKTPPRWEAFEYSNLGWVARKEINSAWTTVSCPDQRTAEVYAEKLNEADARLRRANVG